MVSVDREVMSRALRGHLWLAPVDGTMWHETPKPDMVKTESSDLIERNPFGFELPRTPTGEAYYAAGWNRVDIEEPTDSSFLQVTENVASHPPSYSQNR